MFSSVAKVLSWINWVQMACLGVYTAYFFIANYDETGSSPTTVVLGIYLAIFGIVGVVFEAGVKAIRRQFAFLESWGSKGWFFLFCASLGMSYGWETKPPGRIVPFVLGIFSAVCCIFCWIAACESTNKQQDEDGKYQTVLDRSAGPNKI